MDPFLKDNYEEMKDICDSCGWDRNRCAQKVKFMFNLLLSDAEQLVDSMFVEENR